MRVLNFSLTARGRALLGERERERESFIRNYDGLWSITGGLGRERERERESFIRNYGP